MGDWLVCSVCGTVAASLVTCKCGKLRHADCECDCDRDVIKIDLTGNTDD